MEYIGEETIIENENGQDEGWVETHHYDATTNELEDKVCEMTLDNNRNDDEDEIAGNMEDENVNDDDIGDADGDEGEAADMEDFEESGMLEMVDPVRIPPIVESILALNFNSIPNKTLINQFEIHIWQATAITRPKVESNVTNKLTDVSDVDQVIHTRTYDLHITYDKYYQTPRLWVVGYDENRQPLNVEQMYEDVSQDHAKKTVTMESHPHLPGPNMASVHPCKWVSRFAHHKTPI